MDVLHRAQSKALRWLLWSFAGGLLGSIGITIIVVLLVLVILVSAIVGYSDSKGTALAAPTTHTTVSAGTTITTAATVWTGKRNQAVVAAALHIVPALYNGPPQNYDTWYQAAMIPDAIAYWTQTCAGCPQWDEGNLQCVMLITAAYGLAGQTLPYVGDAATFWTSHVYAHTSGWEEVQPNEMPMPGDIGVLSSPYEGGVGHVFIIVDVKPPGADGLGGYVQFAQANAQTALTQEPLRRDYQGHLQMEIWSNYTVLGYLRHTADIK